MVKLASAALLSVGLISAAWASEAEMVLSNRNTSLTFARTEGGFCLAHLRCLRPSHDFFPPGGSAGPLWRIVLRPRSYDEAQQVQVDSVAHAELSWSKRATEEGWEVTLRWTGVDVPGEPGALDVTVSVSLAGGDALSHWRISVANRSERLGLWTVDFPLFPDLTVGAEGELACPLGWGVLYKDPVRTGNHSATYPSLFATMQFCSLSEAGAGLYVSSHDPDGYLKQLNWKAHPDAGRLEYFLRQYPEDMGLPGKPYASPYPVAIGCLPGDWLDAAKRYRRWVVAEAPWVPKVPLEHHAGTPQWLKDNALWLQSNGRGSDEPTDSLLNCVEIRRAMPDVPMADQLYWWQKEWPGQAQFDEGYPDQFFELGRGETEQAALGKLDEAGVRRVPYTNPNLVDARTEYWKRGGWRWAALPAEQAGRKDEWLADINPQAAEGKVVNVTMCPYCPERQDVVVDWARRIVGEFGFDGVYLDQVACIDPVPCFDPSHGHPLGGGKHWVEGYRRMLARVQAAVRELDPDAVLTTESACEAFGVFDAYLRCNENQGWVSPIWSAVYCGLSPSYGGYLYSEDQFGGCLYAAKLAQQFTYGAQLGWLGAHHDISPRPSWLDYLHELCEARVAANRWIGLGEYVRPPRVEGAEKVTGRWKLFGSEYDVTWPAVLSAAFRAADGSVALVFTNFSGAEQSFTWTARLRELGLPVREVAVNTLHPSGAAEAPTRRTGGRLSGDLTMAPLSAVVLVVE